MDTHAVSAVKEDPTDAAVVKRTWGDRLFRLFWLGIAAAVIGVIAETVFMLITRHRLMNRSGLLYGQLSLVWGGCAILFTLCLEWLKKRGVWVVLLGGMAVGTSFEYLCSVFQDYCLGMVFWDYSHLPFSIGGRVNLLFSLMWGLGAALWFFLLLPRLDALLDRSPKRWRKTITVAVAVTLAADMALTAGALARMGARHENIPADSPVAQFLDRHYPDEVLYSRFTDMQVSEEYIIEHPNFRKN